jgi:hypothetical protein
VIKRDTQMLELKFRRTVVAKRLERSWDKTNNIHEMINVYGS